MRNIEKLDIIMKEDDVVKHIQLNLNGKNGNREKRVIIMKLPKARQLLVVKTVCTTGKKASDIY